MKPVAWMVNNKLYQDIFEAEHYSKFTNKPMILLYTHPVKEITDEEIELIADQFKEGEHWKQEYKWSIPQEDFVDFARAILRKAKEK